MDFTTEETVDTLGKSHWYCEMASGKTIIQNDQLRNGKWEPDWLRLKEYMKETGDKIVNMRIRYWDHVESPLPANAKGYFFSNMSASINGGPTRGFFVIGHIENDKVKIKKFAIPELIESEDMAEERDLTSEAIILNE